MTTLPHLGHWPVACALCGADDARLIRRTRGFKGHCLYLGEEALPLAGDEALVRCRRCGLAYINPQPHVAAPYRTYPTSEEVSYFAATRSSRLLGAEHLLDTIASLAPRKGRVLDVGCGDGAFMGVATRLGWDAWGVDASAALVEKIRGGELGDRAVVGDAARLGAESEAFDLVLLINVLEHVLTPGQVLAEAARVARPDGLVAVHVPNYDWGRFLGKRWRQLEPLDHLTYYGWRTLCAHLQSVGLEPVQRFSLPGGLRWKASLQRVLNAMGLWPGSGLGVIARKKHLSSE